MRHAGRTAGIGVRTISLKPGPFCLVAHDQVARQQVNFLPIIAQTARRCGRPARTAEAGSDCPSSRSHRAPRQGFFAQFPAGSLAACASRSPDRPDGIRDAPLRSSWRSSSSKGFRDGELILERVAIEHAIDELGAAIPVESAETVPLRHEVRAGIKHLVLRVAGGEFRADRVPGELEEFDTVLRRGGRRLLRLFDQSADFGAGEILRSRTAA